MRKLFEEPALDVLEFGENDVVEASDVQPTAAPCDWELPDD